MISYSDVTLICNCNFRTVFDDNDLHNLTICALDLASFITFMASV